MIPEINNLGRLIRNQVKERKTSPEFENECHKINEGLLKTILTLIDKTAQVNYYERALVGYCDSYRNVKIMLEEAHMLMEDMNDFRYLVYRGMYDMMKECRQQNINASPEVINRLSRLDIMSDLNEAFSWCIFEDITEAMGNNKMTEALNYMDKNYDSIAANKKNIPIKDLPCVFWRLGQPIDSVSAKERKQDSCKTMTMKELIGDILPQVKSIRMWFAVYKAFEEKNLVNKIDFTGFKRIIEEAYAEELPCKINARELSAMNCLSFTKPIEEWDISNAPIKRAANFYSYKELAKITLDLLEDLQTSK